MTIKKTVKK